MRKVMGMKKIMMVGLFFSCVVAASASSAPKDVPELMTAFGGEKISSVEQWEKVRSPEPPLQDGCVSYHLRTGKHNLTPYDWKCYMDFADRHGWRK